jgi:glutamate/tyrosine decarboxylase-like PLP-dependent enzyme
VATTADHAAARKIAQALNQGGLDIHGHIEALQIERRVGEVVKQIAEAPLSKAGWFS